MASGAGSAASRRTARLLRRLRISSLDLARRQDDGEHHRDFEIRRDDDKRRAKHDRDGDDDDNSDDNSGKDDGGNQSSAATAAPPSQAATSITTESSTDTAPTAAGTTIASQPTETTVQADAPQTSTTSTDSPPTAAGTTAASQPTPDNSVPANALQASPDPPSASAGTTTASQPTADTSAPADALQTATDSPPAAANAATANQPTQGTSTQADTLQTSSAPTISTDSTQPTQSTLVASTPTSDASAPSFTALADTLPDPSTVSTSATTTSTSATIAVAIIPAPAPTNGAAGNQPPTVPSGLSSALTVPTVLPTTLATSLRSRPSSANIASAAGSNTLLDSARSSPDNPTIIVPPVTKTAGLGAAVTPTPTVATIQDQQHRKEHKGHPGMSPALEGVAILFSILGLFAIIAFATLFIKRRRQRERELLMSRRLTKSSMTAKLFAPDRHMHTPDTAASQFPPLRPEETYNSKPAAAEAPADPIVPAAARPLSIAELPGSMPTIPPPPMSANPFADPPLQRAYDLLRGEPRGSVMTRSKSWLRNPFEDPSDPRFDPFGHIRRKRERERQLKAAGML